MSQQIWLKTIAETDLCLRETIAHKLAEMRRELERDNQSPMQKLMIDRVLACWVQAHHADMLVAGNQGQSASVCKDLLDAKSVPNASSQTASSTWQGCGSFSLRPPGQPRPRPPTPRRKPLRRPRLSAPQQATIP
jgi:hypothetical protein